MSARVTSQPRFYRIVGTSAARAVVQAGVRTQAAQVDALWQLLPLAGGQLLSRQCCKIQLDWQSLTGPDGLRRIAQTGQDCYNYKCLIHYEFLQDMSESKPV